MTPTLLDSNLFIGLDQRFSLSEAVQHAREVLKEGERLGYSPVILSCVLDEIHRNEIRSAILECCRISRVTDEEANSVAERTRHRLTQPGNLTDYKLIAAGLARAGDRPLLVSSDFLLRYEFAQIVETGDVMTPYQYTHLLDQRSPSPIMGIITKRLLDHFLENEGPEAFKKQQLELKKEAEELKRQKLSASKVDVASLVGAYLSGSKLSRGQKQAIASFRPILDRVKGITNQADPLLEIEVLRAQMFATLKTVPIEGISPILRELGHFLLIKGDEAREAGDPDLSLRYMDEASTMLALSSEGSEAFYIKLNGLRALEYMLKGEVRHAIRILEGVGTLLGGKDVRSQAMVWCTMGVAWLLLGDEERAEEFLAKVPHGVDRGKTLKDFGDHFYRHRLHREALAVYRFLVLGGWVREEIVEPLYSCAGILGEELEKEVVAAIRPELRVEDHTRSPMPYLTKDSGLSQTILEDGSTPKYFRDPMRVCNVHRTRKGTLLVCWNRGLSSRIGVNLPRLDREIGGVEWIRLNAGPVKIKNTLLGSAYGIRGEIDTSPETEIELVPRGGSRAVNG